MLVKLAIPSALFCASLFASGAVSALCITVPEANLRQGPGTHHEKSWEVFKYMPLQEVGKRGAWYQVEDVDGESHWVHSRLVTNAIRCAVVKVDEANVRSGPGTGYAKSPLSPVEKYYSFKVLDTEGEWVKVQDQVPNDGWVAKELLWIR